MSEPPDNSGECDPLASVRHQLAVLARRKRARVLDWPREWKPWEVQNPARPNECFTEAGAWEFLADLLEKRHPMEEVKQDNPPGVVAYQMTVDLGLENCPPVFIKIRLGAGKILGRSFHYATVRQT